jgi:hypothetical protein
MISLEDCIAICGLDADQVALGMVSEGDLVDRGELDREAGRDW